MLLWLLLADLPSRLKQRFIASQIGQNTSIPADMKTNFWWSFKIFRIHVFFVCSAVCCLFFFGSLAYTNTHKVHWNNVAANARRSVNIRCMCVCFNYVKKLSTQFDIELERSTLLYLALYIEKYFNEVSPFTTVDWFFFRFLTLKYSSFKGEVFKWIFLYLALVHTPTHTYTHTYAQEATGHEFANINCIFKCKSIVRIEEHTVKTTWNHHHNRPQHSPLNQQQDRKEPC